MSDTEQNRETMAAVGFAGLLSLVFGPLGLFVAASAVAIQKACFPNVGENTERAEKREHERSLDKAAARQRRNARHQSWLDELAATRQAHREEVRAWDGNPATRPVRPAVGKGGRKHKPGFFRRLGEAMLFGAAHAVLASDRAREAYPQAYDEARQRREAGQPVVRPAVGELVDTVLRRTKPDGTAEPASEPTPEPAAEPAPASTPEQVAEPQAGKPEQAEPVTAPTEEPAAGDSPTEQTPQAEAGTDSTTTPPATDEPAPAGPADGELADTVAWYGDDKPATEPQTAAQGDGELADTVAWYGDNQPATAPAPTENTDEGTTMKSSATARQGENNLDLIDRGLGGLGEIMAAANEIIDRLGPPRQELAVVSRELAERAGANAPTATRAAADAGMRLVQAVDEGINATSTAVAAAGDQIGAARRGLKPARDAEDQVRQSGANPQIFAKAR